MADAFTIRPYRPADEEQVWRVHERATKRVDAFADPDGIEGGATTDRAQHAAESRDLAERGVFLVGTTGGDLIAMGALNPVGNETAELTRMRVDPDHWGQGYGRAMLDALEARAIRRNYEELVLETLARQTAARGLYEDSGYVEVERLDTDEFDVRRYRKSLE